MAAAPIDTLLSEVTTLGTNFRRLHKAGASSFEALARAQVASLTAKFGRVRGLDANQAVELLTALENPGFAALPEELKSQLLAEAGATALPQGSSIVAAEPGAPGGGSGSTGAAAASGGRVGMQNYENLPFHLTAEQWVAITLHKNSGNVTLQETAMETLAVAPVNLACGMLARRRRRP